MTRLRSAVLGVLLLGFGGAGMTGACVGGAPAPGECTAPDPDPPVEQPTDCATPVEKPCMRYRIPLQGNPSIDVALQKKYKAAFGDACYVSAANTFDCFYEDPQEACKDAVLVPKVFGAAPYDEAYTCQKVGTTDDYLLQVGSDAAIKIDIKLEAAPLQTSLIEVKGGSTEVNGPYRNLVEVTPVKPDKGFDCTSGQVGADGTTLNQREWVLEVNRKAHGGEIHSDLEGFTWPCEDENCKPTTCTEKLVLLDPDDDKTPDNDPDRAQVHHVVPRKDLRRCRWGTNAYKNAAVISTRLNRFLSNKVPPEKEVLQINNVPPYTPP